MEDQATEMLERINDKLKQRKLIKENYNIFSVLEIENKELIHSRFLAHLIDPKGKNENHQRFLNSFLLKFIPKEQEKFLNVLVKTEQTLKNEKLDLGRADIWIKAKEKNDYIIIENKLFAGDQKQQLKRYSDYLKGKRSDGTSRSGILLYLTLNGKEASNHSTDYNCEKFYESISYAQISSWIKEEIKKEHFSEPFATSLNHYRNTVDKLVMKYEILNIIKGFPELPLDCLKDKSVHNSITEYIIEKKIVESLHAEYELEFWNAIEEEIRKLSNKIHSQRKYSYERVFNRNEKKKIDKEYGLIFDLKSEIYRISVDRNGKLSIRIGALQNGDLKFDGKIKFIKNSDIKTLTAKVINFLETKQI